MFASNMCIKLAGRHASLLSFQHDGTLASKHDGMIAGSPHGQQSCKPASLIARWVEGWAASLLACQQAGRTASQQASRPAGMSASRLTGWPGCAAQLFRCEASGRRLSTFLAFGSIRISALPWQPCGAG
jgi:hypothetical protein